MSDNEITWRCMDCDVTWTTQPERHVMSYCPSCDEQYVDHEKAYVRRSLSVEPVSGYED